MWKLLLLLLLSAQAFGQASSILVSAVDKEGRGVVLGLDVEVREGKGRILLSTIPFTGIDTQYSEQEAVKYAQNYTGYDFSGKDVIFTFVGNATSIDGQSAGAAMAAAVISIAQGKGIRKDAVLTGTIEADGSIGKVGGTYAKALAAANAGANLFLLPNGQKTQAEAIKRIVLTDYGTAGNAIEPYALDLSEYSREKWGMEVREAGNISEALQYLYSKEGEKKEPAGEFEYSLQKLEFTEDEQVLVEMGDERTAKAEKNIEKLEKEDLGPEELKAAAERVKKAREKLQNAKKYRQLGYAYTYANNAFLAEMETNIALDLAGNKSQEELLDRSAGKLAELEKEIAQKGYSKKNIKWLVAAQERYTWAWQQNVLLKNAAEGGELPDEAFFSQYEVISSWLSIAEDFLAKTGNGNLTFSSRIADLAQDRIKKAERDVYAIKLFNLPDPYSSETYLLAGKEELSKGWYIAAAYDGIYAKGRALASNPVDARQKALEEITVAERYVGAGDNFWALQYLKHAKTALSEKDRDKAAEAYTYANIAKELARYEIELSGIELKQPGEAPVIIELPGKTKVPKEAYVAAIAVSILYLFFSLWLFREIGKLRRELGNRKVKEHPPTKKKG